MSLAFLLTSRTHPKVIMLRRKLGDSGVLALHYLWAFCEEYKKAGIDSPLTQEDLLGAADFSQNKNRNEELFDTLLELKLVENSPEGLTVHGFIGDGLNSSCEPIRKKPTRRSKKPKEASSDPDDVWSVLGHYRTVNPTRGRTIKPGNRDWQRIQARLTDGYTVDELKLAIDGNQLHQWHIDHPAGHSVEYIFRNSTKVEQFIELARNGVKDSADSIVGHHRGSKEFNDGDQRARF